MTTPETVILTDYEIIEKDLRSASIVNRVVRALGYRANDDDGREEALRYIGSVLAEVQKTMGDDRKDLTKCSTESIIQSMIDAASFKIPIDGRKLAYLIGYKGVASFQPGFGGFMYKISEFCKNVDYTSTPVFKGDTVKLTDESGFQGYTLDRANPFEDSVELIIGMIGCLSWTDDSGALHRKVEAVPRSEIDKMRKAAKQDFIWNAWFIEKARAATLKRLCKIQFKNVLGLQELIDYDNDKNFDIEKLSDANMLSPANPAAKMNETIEAVRKEGAVAAIEHKPETALNIIPETKTNEAVTVGGVKKDSDEVTRLKTMDKDMKELSARTGNAVVKEAMKDGVGNLVKAAELLEENDEAFSVMRQADKERSHAVKHIVADQPLQVMTEGGLATIDASASPMQQADLLPPAKDDEPTVSSQAKELRGDFAFSPKFYRIDTIAGATAAANDLMEILKKQHQDDRQLVFSDCEGGVIVKALRNKGQSARVERFRELGIKIA